MTPRTAPHSPEAGRHPAAVSRAVSAAVHSAPVRTPPDHAGRDGGDPSCREARSEDSTEPAPQLSSSFDGTTVVVSINGKLNQATAPSMWRAVYTTVDRAGRSSVVVLDLSGADYVDSLGITTLINLHQRSRRQHIALRVVTAPGQLVRRMLTLAGVDTLLSVHDSLEKALGDPSAPRHDTRVPPEVSPDAEGLC